MIAAIVITSLKNFYSKKGSGNDLILYKGKTPLTKSLVKISFLHYRS